jgi:HEAT repeat protein
MMMCIKSIVTSLLLIYFCDLTTQAQVPTDKAWSILQQGTADSSSERRSKAFRALALLTGNETAQKMAESALADESAEVRSAAASALGRIGAKTSISKLQQAVRDKDVSVVLAATDALFRLGDPSSFHVYYAVLTGEKKSGEGLLESQMKMIRDPKAMAQMGFEVGIGFVPFAGAGYKVFKVVRKDDSSPVRAAAATRLAGDPDPKSGEALARTANDPKWIVRAAVVDAIARRGDPSLLKAVVPLLDDENDAVKFSAAAAVVRLSDVKK